MGAYSPVPQIGADTVQTAIDTVLIPAAKAMVQENRSFCGILYAGLIKTVDGPKVIEFNARFGDPETQVVLPRLRSDLVQVILELLAGKTSELIWDDQMMVGVVVAAKGYPEKYEKGALLTGLADFNDEVVTFHAGTVKNQLGEFVTSGGRVLLVGAKAENLEEAQEKVYSELEKLACDDVFYRKDIGSRAIQSVKG
jgi:phosphoribosylamine--glycine ligase